MPFNTIEDALAALAKQAMLGPVLQDSLVNHLLWYL